MINLLTELDVKETITVEDTRRAIETLKNISLAELGITYSVPDRLEGLSESIEMLRVALEQVAPNIDFKNFIKVLLVAPLRKETLDFDAIINLMNNLNVRDFHEGSSSIDVSITVIQSGEPDEGKIDWRKYCKICGMIFPIITFLITQYQTQVTTEQLNRIEIEQQRIEIEQQQRDEQQNEQLNHIESLLEQFLEEHNNVKEHDCYIEIEKQIDSIKI